MTRAPAGHRTEVGSDFTGPTARAYRRFRPDLPGPVLDGLVAHLGLAPGDRAVDLGAGTGQVAVGLARRLAGVLALDPEPDMLAELRRRLAEEDVVGVLCGLAGDRDMPALARVTGGGWGLLTVANALHWMDAEGVAAGARELLRPGGGIAVVTHGRPLWLGDRDWARALRGFLESRLGPVRSGCGTDRETLERRRRLLVDAGFADVTVLEHRFERPLDADRVVGNMASALSAGQVPADRWAEFEAGLRTALAPFEAAPLIEDVPVEVLVGRR